MSHYLEHDISYNRNSKTLSSTLDIVLSSSSLLRSEVLIVTKSGSTIGAIWNVINLIQGIGILGLPFAIMESGWIGVAITVIAAFVCCSTGKMIIDCLYETFEQQNIKTRVHLDYPDIGAKVWPRFGRGFVVALSLIEMFGASTLYVILLGTSSYTLIQGLDKNLTEQYWFIIGAVLILCLLFINKMSIISWFSMIAVTCLLGTTLTILSYCFTKYVDINMKNINTLSIKNLPISAGIIIFSFCAHPVLPTIEASMRHPELFKRVLNMSFTVATITKLVFGIIPVCIFGNKTFQTISKNILYSDLGFFISIRLFVIFNVLFSMPLLVYIIFAVTDQRILQHFHFIFWPRGKLNFLWLFVSRTILILTILLTALIVPYFALVMGFVGSFTGTCLTFILPCWFSLSLKSKELNICQKVYRICVIIMGVSFGIMGMWFSGMEMNNLSRHH